MKRIACRSMSITSTGLYAMLSLVAVTVTADQPAGANPLRTPPKLHKADPNAAPVVGSAVRSGSSKREVGRPSVARSEATAPTTRAQRASGHSNQGVTPAAYRRRVPKQDPVESVPYEEVLPEQSVLGGTVTVQDYPGEIMAGGDCADCAVGGMAGGGFPGDCCGGTGCMQCCMPCPSFRWDDLTIFGGAMGFTGPKNRGQTGSFGFYEGLNWGAPMPCMNNCLGIQLGARTTQSNLSGAEFTPDDRGQVFVTGGIFRKVDWGLQGGIVFDYMSDDWYSDTDLTQIRGEIGWVFPCEHELGFWMTQSLEEDTATGRVFSTSVVSTTPTETWESTDLYAFYYRHQFQDWEGASGRVFAGFSGSADGFIGTDFKVALTCDLALEAGFSYLVPEESKGPAGIGNEHESWNVAVGIVWYPGCSTANAKSYYGPLLNVADNGSFMVDRLR